MPALNVEFTEEEMAQLRDAAGREDKSLRSMAHDAIVSELRRRKVTAAATRVAGISAGLNERLAEK
ncbi:hypothetical protein J2S53_001282 [Actinopolyspora lacussalsi]|nr:hypothetical protein [Actinopolyspora lacussalsi]